MSKRKVTPRTLITDFLTSDVPEQSALRPSRRRTTRNLSGPEGTAKSSRQHSKLITGDKKSMHLSLIDDTPRTLVRVSRGEPNGHRSRLAIGRPGFDPLKGRDVGQCLSKSQPHHTKV